MKNDPEKSFHLFMKSVLFLPYVARPLLYKPYKYVPPQRVWVLRHFGLKRGIHFAHFGLESGIVFGGTVGVYEGGGGVFIVSIPNELERRRNCFCKFFLLDLPNLKRQPIQFITNLGLLSF